MYKFPCCNVGINFYTNSFFQESFLGLYLHCDSESKKDEWSFKLLRSMWIINSADKKVHLNRLTPANYSKPGHNAWGVNHFISWKDLTNPNRKLIKVSIICLYGITENN